MRIGPIRVLSLAVALAFAAGTDAIAQRTNPCAANPCAVKNPCAAKAAAVVKDPSAEATFKTYKAWKKVNMQPVPSQSHGGRLVFTYLNRKAESTGLDGKFPFPEGAVLAKESFESEGGKVGAKGPLFIMEKRKRRYDAAHNDWHYATVGPDGKVTVSGDGKDGSATQFCAACHSVARVNDYVFGNGTIMKVKPTPMGAPAPNPCAPRNPCVPKK